MIAAQPSAAATLRRAFTILITMMVVLALAGMLATVLAVRSVHRLSNDLQPAAAANRAALQALTDAQTAVRGYQLTGDPALLRNYDRGRAQFRRQLTIAESSAGDLDVAVVLDRQRHTGSLWITKYGQPMATASGGSISGAWVRSGQVAFDQFRADNAEADERLAAEGRRLGQRGAILRTAAMWVFAALAALSLLIAVGTARSVARMLRRPLAELHVTLQQLTAGDTTARVQVTGPAEITDVALAVNALADEAERLRQQDRERERLGRCALDAVARMGEQLDARHVFHAGAEETARALDADRVQLRAVNGSEVGAVIACSSPLGDDWGASDGLGVVVPTTAEWLGGVDLPGCVGMDDTTLAGAATRSVLLAAEVEAFLADSGGRAFLAAAVRVNGQVRAWLCVSMLGEPRDWTAAERSFVEAVTNDMGRALHQAELYAQQVALVAQLRDLDRTKSDFLSTVSHELRTPLTSISGYAELLRDEDAGPVTEEQDAMLAVITRNADRLRLLIEDLLTLSRIESNALRMGSAPVALDEIVEAAIGRTRASAIVGDLEIEQVGRLTDLQLLGDRIQLERMLVNLLGNAVKFSPDGGRIEVRVWAEDGAVVQIRDHGIGIPQDEQHHLLSRFFRASNATARAIQGTGLGLTIARSVVEHHGGTLHIESSEGVGTRVTVRLPAPSTAAAHVIRAERNAPGASGSAASPAPASTAPESAAPGSTAPLAPGTPQPAP